MILAAALGIEQKEIAVLMGWGDKRLNYYFTRMHNLGITKQVIEKSGIRVYYDAKTGEIAADWKLHKDRFPRLAKRMEQAEGRVLDRQEGKYITRVRRKAALYEAKLEK